MILGVVRACGLGVVRLSGLKLCPIMVSLVLTLAFQRGRPSSDDTDEDNEGRGSRFCVGVAVSLYPGEGEARPVDELYVESREFSGFRGNEQLVTDRRPLPGGILDLPPERKFLPGVEGSSPPITPLMTTDEAGELPGVSIMLPKVERSFETMLEIESRNC